MIKESLIVLCKEKLPERAQPVRYEFLDELPLTPIGKEDYRALEKAKE